MISANRVFPDISMFLLVVLVIGCNSFVTPSLTQPSVTNTPALERESKVTVIETITPELGETPETIIPPIEIVLAQFMVAFTSIESFESLPETDLYIMNGNGSGVKNITDIHNISYPRFPTWSPDGSRIAFLDCAGGGFDPGNMLYVITRDGTNLTSMEPILSAKGVTPYCSFESSSVSWSPDGQRFAFRGATTIEPWRTGIYLLSADGDSLENLSKNFMYERISSCPGVPEELLKQCQEERTPERSLQWSPDGSMLAFVVDQEIYVVGLDGNNLRKLTELKRGAYAINWAPDSKYIIYANESDSGIYLVSVDDAKVKRVGEGHAPDLSPDGTQIAFTRPFGGIYVMDINGQNRMIIASSPPSPQWSPDGNFIAFADTRTIWLISKDGSWKKKLVTDVGVIHEISISK